MKGVAYHGWKLGLPDKFWPVTFDNFFDNPDEIRELGLRSLESDKAIKSTDDEFDFKGLWPGIRSEELWKIDERLNQKITEKILSCYFNLDIEKVFWNHIDIRFNLVPSIDKDKNSAKNKGWIHRDSTDPRHLHFPEPQGVAELAGLIYLTPDIERDTGTSLFDMKKDETLEDWDKTKKIRKQPSGLDLGFSDEEIETAWKKHRNCFIEKVRFENIYNRLIMYDAREFHGANSLYTLKDNRLTLGFFIGEISANKWPLQRVKEIKC